MGSTELNENGNGKGDLYSPWKIQTAFIEQLLDSIIETRRYYEKEWINNFAQMCADLVACNEEQCVILCKSGSASCANYAKMMRKSSQKKMRKKIAIPRKPHLTQKKIRSKWFRELEIISVAMKIKCAEEQRKYSVKGKN